MTLFDENGAVFLTCMPDLVDALTRHDWTTLFVNRRADWSARAQVCIFGHALFEKLENPRVDLCAHARIWLMSSADWEAWCDLSTTARRQQVDAWLAGELRGRIHTPSDLQPLPVMGVPGWHADNADSAFYNNPTVFRPPRTR